MGITGPSGSQHFEVVSESVLHQRYLTVLNRRVRFTTPGQPECIRELEFDVAGHPRANFSFSVVFPFHPYKDGRKGGEVTVIREYGQGPNSMIHCLPSGGFDPHRHADLLACARAELSEEAWLTGGRWVRLLPEDHAGMPEVKWCANRFVPFLVIDPQPDENPGNRDAEEITIEVLRVPLEAFSEMVFGGDVMLPSVATHFLAMKRLREEGLVN